MVFVTCNYAFCQVLSGLLRVYGLLGVGFLIFGFGDLYLMVAGMNVTV